MDVSSFVTSHVGWRRLTAEHSRLNSEDRLAWVQHERKRHAIYRQKEYAYWNLRHNCLVQTTLGPVPATFDQFEPCATDDVQQVVTGQCVSVKYV